MVETTAETALQQTGVRLTPQRLAIAERVTSRPSHGILVSAALAVLFTWAGLTVAYYVPYPVGFFITTFAFLSYVVARLLSYLGARRTVRPRGWREAQVRHSP